MFGYYYVILDNCAFIFTCLYVYLDQELATLSKKKKPEGRDTLCFHIWKLMFLVGFQNSEEGGDLFKRKLDLLKRKVAFPNGIIGNI